MSEKKDYIIILPNIMAYEPITIGKFVLEEYNPKKHASEVIVNIATGLVNESKKILNEETMQMFCLSNFLEKAFYYLSAVAWSEKQRGNHPKQNFLEHIRHAMSNT